MEELPTGNHRRNASAVMGANLVLRNSRLRLSEGQNMRHSLGKDCLINAILF